MRLPQEPDDQSQETNLKSWCYRTPCFGDAMTLLLLFFFFFKGNGSLKIDRSVKCHDIGLVWKLFAPSCSLLVMGSGLNFPDKCKDHFSLSSYDFSAVEFTISRVAHRLEIQMVQFIQAESFRKRWKSSDVFLFSCSNRNDRKNPVPFVKSHLTRFTSASVPPPF